MKTVKQEKDRLHAILLAAFLVLLLMCNVSALNAKIGNGKIVLYVKVGDVVEKSVRVINDNNVSVNIELIPDGDLKDSIKFKDANFTLEPYEETDAEYSLKVTKEGRSDSYINVIFTPVEGKNGIVLPASIIIFAQKGNGTAEDDNGLSDWLDTDNADSGDDEENKINPVAIGLVITAIVFVVLLVLLYVHSKSKNKKDENLNQKKKAK